MMTARKILFLVLCVGLVANVAAAKVIDGVLYEIPKTTIVPVIDGKMDAVWKTLDWNFQNSYDNGNMVPDGWYDLFGASKMMWDDENLYGLFYAQDDILVDVHANSWERDAVEFYSDADNSKGTAAFDGVNDQHLSFRHEFIDNETANVANLGWITGTVTDGTEFKFLDDSTAMGGYWLEFKIPLEALSIPGIPGQEIGVEWQQNDNDGTSRESISKWWLDAGDNSWLYPSLWGTGVLTDRSVTDAVEIKKVPAGTTITIDGELDPVYTQGDPITQNSHGNGNMVPTDFQDAFTRTYLLYDDDNLYGYFDTYDETLVDVHANSWERDGVELYTDADNSKGPTAFDGVNDTHLSFYHAFMGNEAASIANLGWITGTVTDGTEFVIVDDSLGYNVEFKIPLEALSIPAIEGQIIGLEVQMDDNDGTSRESISKWWLESGDNSWLYPALWGTATMGSLVTGVEEKKPAPVVDSYSLEQNYPNPFNPSTTIFYSLKSNGKVRLSVYDLMGREVAVLVDGNQSSGRHDVAFSGANLTSGIYFYKLQTASEVITKKMTLMK